MKLPAVLAVAVLASGCAAFDDTSYMPSESQLKGRNPKLLNCAPGSAPLCDAIGGGRVAKRYINCVCSNTPF